MTESFAVDRRYEAEARIRRFLDQENPSTPCLVIDLETIRSEGGRVSTIEQTCRFPTRKLRYLAPMPGDF